MIFCYSFLCMCVFVCLCVTSFILFYFTLYAAIWAACRIYFDNFKYIPFDSNLLYFIDEMHQKMYNAIRMVYLVYRCVVKGPQWHWKFEKRWKIFFWSCEQMFTWKSRKLFRKDFSTVYNYFRNCSTLFLASSMCNIFSSAPSVKGTYFVSWRAHIVNIKRLYVFLNLQKDLRGLNFIHAISVYTIHIYNNFNYINICVYSLV